MPWSATYRENVFQALLRALVSLLVAALHRTLLFLVSSPLRVLVGLHEAATPRALLLGKPSGRRPALQSRAPRVKTQAPRWGTCLAAPGGRLNGC